MRLGLGLGLGSSTRAWSPASAGVPLVGWWQSDVGFVANTSWADQSGAGNHLTCSGGATVGATQNGRATVALGGAATVQVNTPAIGGTGALSAFAVVKQTTSGGVQRITGYYDGGVNSHSIYSDSNIATAGHGISFTTGTSDIHGAWKRVGVTGLQGGNVELFVDGASEASAAYVGAIGEGAGWAFGIGLLPFIGQCLTGLVAEVVLYRGVLGGPDIASLDAYFAAAWGI